MTCYDIIRIHREIEKYLFRLLFSLILAVLAFLFSILLAILFSYRIWMLFRNIGFVVDKETRQRANNVLFPSHSDFSEPLQKMLDPFKYLEMM